MVQFNSVFSEFDSQGHQDFPLESSKDENFEDQNEEEETFEPIDASKLKLRKPPVGSKIANLKETIEQQVRKNGVSS